MQYGKKELGFLVREQSSSAFIRGYRQAVEDIKRLNRGRKNDK